MDGGIELVGEVDECKSTHYSVLRMVCVCKSSCVYTKCARATAGNGRL